MRETNRPAKTGNRLTDVERAIERHTALNGPWRHTDVPIGQLVAATRALHDLDLAWARSAITRDWAQCHGCATRAKIAIEAARKEQQ